MLDSHHHLWRYSESDYPWIPKASELAKDHLLPELETVTALAGVTGTIVVQARQTLEESDWLLSLADQTALIKAVVGWVPLVDENVGAHLERLAARPKFKGVRHVLQDEPDEYFLRAEFHRGLAQIPAHGLTYDLLIFQRQIPLALQLLDRHPDLPVVIDHLAKPAARNGRVEPAWRSGMKELAKRDNVTGVKFSGLPTEFPAGEGDPETLVAYFHETLEIFGPNRILFGTDWPVCLLRNSYLAWTETLLFLTKNLSPHEQAALHRENAKSCYRL